MSTVKLSVKNYRCFPDKNPFEFEIRPDVVSFVGKNNSGKSAALRFFYEFRHFFRDLHTRMFVHDNAGHFRFDNPLGVADSDEIFSNTNDRNIVIRFDFESKNHRINENTNTIGLEIEVRRPEEEMVECRQRLFVNSRESEHYQVDRPDNQNQILSVPDKDVLTNVTWFFDFIFGLQNSIYIGPFRNAILVSAANYYYDINIGSDFVQNWRKLKTGSNKSDNKLAIEVENEIKRLFDFDVFSINAADGQSNLQLIINNKAYRLQEIGAGIAQIIILLTHIITKKPDYVLIDEPELNLHPTLVVDFVSTLSKYANSGVIFTTHSLGLARSVSNRIFSFVMAEWGISESKMLEEMPNYVELLGELNYSSYREMGYETILLVEGRTEIKTFFQFFRHYGLDQKVVTISLGGANMINAKVEQELEELRRISPSIFAVIDGEKSSKEAEISEERQKFVQICNKLGINILALEKGAIENYFPDESIKEVYGPKFRALMPYEKLSDLEHGWAKSDNWRIAGHMPASVLQNSEIGKFLKEIAASIQ